MCNQQNAVTHQNQELIYGTHVVLNLLKIIINAKLDLVRKYWLGIN